MLQKTAPRVKRITFSLNVPGASKVMLAGDFNNWSCKETALRKTRKDLWEKDLVLGPGKYEYKFVVDGNWVTDPNNSNLSWNSFGTQNSVIEV